MFVSTQSDTQSLLSFFFILSIHWICYNIISVLYFGFFWPGVMWDLRSPARDRAYKPCVGRQSLNHWTAKEAPTVFSWMNEWMKSVTEPRSFESSAQFPERRNCWKQREDGNAKKEREAKIYVFMWEKQGQAAGALRYGRMPALCPGLLVPAGAGSAAHVRLQPYLCRW